MRPRKEIVDNYAGYRDPIFETVSKGGLEDSIILEVLLDIRDLLNEIAEGVIHGDIIRA